MSGNGWAFADLDEAQLELVRLAEQTLDADVVMVFEPTDPEFAVDAANLAPGLRPVRLEPSQLECLQGLEKQVDAVAVAYSRMPA
ncbi:MAG: hypothetical protein H0V74_01905 [Chloroflexi bacterium]|nr:hypothetical protein [Chloroflexota bacterium]